MSSQPEASAEPSAPAISVLMPVYNRSIYLREAVESILQQDFTDFEFIIVDDCSTEDIASIVNAYNDSRIRLIRNEVNSGVARSLNRGLQLCRGEYVVRMDSDDIALPGRLASQLRFMREHPAVVASGSAMYTFGAVEGCWPALVTDEELRANILFDTPIFHPTAIVRRQVLTDNGMTYSESERAEDYDFWYRLSTLGRLANLPEPLLRFRIHEGQTNREILQASASSIRKSILAENFGIGSDEIPSAFFQMSRFPESMNYDELCELKAFFGLLRERNAKAGYVPGHVLDAVLLRRLVSACKQTTLITKLVRWWLMARIACEYPGLVLRDKLGR